MFKKLILATTFIVASFSTQALEIREFGCGNQEAGYSHVWLNIFNPTGKKVDIHVIASDINNYIDTVTERTTSNRHQKLIFNFTHMEQLKVLVMYSENLEIEKNLRGCVVYKAP